MDTTPVRVCEIAKNNSKTQLQAILNGWSADRDNIQKAEACRTANRKTIVTLKNKVHTCKDRIDSIASLNKTLEISLMFHCNKLEKGYFACLALEQRVEILENVVEKLNSTIQNIVFTTKWQISIFMRKMRKMSQLLQ